MRFIPSDHLLILRRAMTSDDIIREVLPPAKPVDIEERGILTDVVVPIVSGGVGGAAGALITNLMQRPSEPQPPPPPSIELPPGVDRE